MKLRVAVLTLMVCALTMLGFQAYTHFAVNPPITDIAGTRSVTHQNTSNGYWISYTYHDAIRGSDGMQDDAAAWATCKKEAVRGILIKSIGSASASVWTPATTSLGPSKGKYHVRAETEPGWWTGPKVDDKRGEYNGQINRVANESSTNWGNDFLSHVTCHAKAKVSNRSGEVHAEGDWDGEPHIWP